MKITSLDNNKLLAICKIGMSEKIIITSKVQILFSIHYLTADMVHKVAILAPAIIVAVVIGVLGLAFIPSEIKYKNTDFPEGTIRIDHDVIKVEIAESDADKQRWLMFREEKLPLNSAMILVYKKPDLYSMWLLNIEYDLDLIWFDQRGNVVYVVKNASPCENTLDAANCTYKNTKPAKYIIAATSGFADEHKITKGSKMTIISI